MLEIITDSCSDLTTELVQERRIKVIPLHVLINGKDTKDGELPTQALFDIVDATGKLPQTSAPSVSEFIEVFSGDEEKLFIGISEKLSGTLKNAKLAAQELPQAVIHIVDSKNLSTGIGLLALKAADLRDAGVKSTEIIAQLNNLTANVRTSFVIDTMEYLYKGGRCSGLQALAGSILKIRPIISVQSDGSLVVKHKSRGSRNHAMNRMLEDLKADLPDVDLKRIFVTHTNCPQDADYLENEISKLAAFDNIQVTTAGATIASHCGPDTIGILYLMKNVIR